MYGRTESCWWRSSHTGRYRIRAWTPETWLRPSSGATECPSRPRCPSLTRSTTWCCSAGTTRPRNGLLLSSCSISLKTLTSPRRFRTARFELCRSLALVFPHFFSPHTHTAPGCYAESLVLVVAFCFYRFCISPLNVFISSSSFSLVSLFAHVCFEPGSVLRDQKPGWTVIVFALLANGVQNNFWCTRACN